MNMYPTLRTMKMKSVIAGEYTAPPVHGPTINESCGINAACLDVAIEDLGVPRERDDALLDARAARVVDADARASRCAARGP